MKQINRKVFVALLLIFALALPAVASAATYINVKVTLNGKTQTLQLPSIWNLSRKMPARHINWFTPTRMESGS